MDGAPGAIGPTGPAGPQGPQGPTGASIGWASSGSDIYNSNGGNVGVGTSTPQAKLDVNGQIRIAGGAPGAGKVLTSDATGLATWEAQPVSPWLDLTYQGTLARGSLIPFTVADSLGGASSSWSVDTFTAPQNGVYLLTVMAYWNATSYGYLRILESGVPIQPDLYANTYTPSPKSYTVASGSIALRLATGDTVQIQYNHDSSAVYLERAHATITLLR